MITLTYLAHVFADPPYFDWYYERLWNQDRSSIFYHTTDIGKADWILWSTAAVILYLSAFRKRYLSASQRWRLHEFFLKVYFIFTAVALSGIATVIFKIFIGRARPRATLPEHDLWNSLPYDLAFGTTSFPSGHATTIGALCLALALLFPRLKFFWLFLALWVAFSRVMVGAHFPSDVVAGLAVGGIVTWVHARNLARLRLLFRFNERGQAVLPSYK